jgi:hypothetical protein
MNLSQLMKLLSILPSIVKTVEVIHQAVPGKASGAAKLAAAVSLAGAAIPAVAKSLQEQPADVSHVESVINSVVAITNAANAWGEAVSP